MPDFPEPPAGAVYLDPAHAIVLVEYQGETAGIDEYHRTQDGAWCQGWIPFRGSAWERGFTKSDSVGLVAARAADANAFNPVSQMRQSRIHYQRSMGAEVSTDRKQYAHLYGRNWRALRDAYLKAHPLCVYCHELGILSPARVVDHVIPHKGDRALFFDQSNWQSLCYPCHDGIKARLERTGRRDGTRLDGTPVDPLHAWNREDAQE